MHQGDLVGGFFDLEMTWLLYCAGAATARALAIQQIKIKHYGISVSLELSGLSLSGAT